MTSPRSEISHHPTCPIRPASEGVAESSQLKAESSSASADGWQSLQYSILAQSLEPDFFLRSADEFPTCGLVGSGRAGNLARTFLWSGVSPGGDSRKHYSAQSCELPRGFW